ncbi:MAG: hypothetical protein JXR65_02525 [Bacteroidales bacterium]|nr:hypothetical protein [Bacteroidales bacterium]
MREIKIPTHQITKKNYAFRFLIFLAVVVLGFSISGCNQAKKENDLTSGNLKGKVKFLRLTTYEPVEKFGELTKGKRVKFSYSSAISDFAFYSEHFDMQGNQTDFAYYKSDGSLIMTFVREYNDKGYHIKTSNYFPQYKSPAVRRFKYNEKNENTEITDYSTNGELTNKSTFIYNSEGKPVQKSNYKADGSLSSRVIYKYKNEGREVDKSTYEPDGSLRFKLINKYDDKENLVESYNYKSDGKLLYSKTYKYGNKGNQTEIKDFDSNGDLDEKVTFKYKFDHQGNWISAVVFVDDKPKYFIQREIEYYSE